MIKCNLTSKHVSKIMSSIIKSSLSDFQINHITTKEFLTDSSIVFIKEITKELSERINERYDVLVITEIPQFEVKNYIQVKNTRLEMARLLEVVNNKHRLYNCNNACISSESKIDRTVVIEPFVYIDSNVTIGENTIIKSGTKILAGTIIGKNTIIRENSVIGGQGFGVEKDEEGNNFKIPHLGGVIIGDHVEIGALNTIVSGTINATVINDFTKIDDHVHIAHNCKIGRNCIITAGTIFSGSVVLGDNSWTGPNSSIKNSVIVARNTLIGIGTVVTKNILSEGLTYAGSPAKEFTQYLEEKKKYEFFLSSYEKFKKLISEEEK